MELTQNIEGILQGYDRLEKIVSQIERDVSRKKVILEKNQEERIARAERARLEEEQAKINNAEASETKVAETVTPEEVKIETKAEPIKEEKVVENVAEVNVPEVKEEPAVKKAEEKPVKEKATPEIAHKSEPKHEKPAKQSQPKAAPTNAVADRNAAIEAARQRAAEQERLRIAELRKKADAEAQERAAKARAEATQNEAKRNEKYGFNTDNLFNSKYQQYHRIDSKPGNNSGFKSQGQPQGFNDRKNGNFKQDNRFNSRDIFNKDKDSDSSESRPRKSFQGQKKSFDGMEKASSVLLKPNENKSYASKEKDKEKFKNLREDFWDDGKVEIKKSGHYKEKNKVKEEVAQVTVERKKAITIGDTVSVKDLSETIGVAVTQIVKKLMTLGVMATINQEIDFDTAQLLADEFDIVIEKRNTKSAETKFEELFKLDNEDVSKSTKRPPVVTVMGHVDHGKTSLLDCIRNSNVTTSEAGGITQHIGAYTVNHKGNKICFIDTPGHEAFTTMRARGAKVTDVAVIVVAANDGVMPQTLEAYNHAVAAQTSIIIAINKIDVPGVDINRVKQQLAENSILVDDWGGEIPCVPVSAKTRQGVDELLEMILLVSDMLELKAPAETHARGTIIEARLDKGKGPVATVLVQTGTLREGDIIIAGTTHGNVRAMFDHNGKKIKKAGPSIPVEITGLNEVPSAGDVIVASDDSKLIRSIVEERLSKQREILNTQVKSVNLDDLFNQIKQGEMKELNLIVKADVQGSVEAVKQSLEKLSNDEVKVKVIHGGVGAVSEADITLAHASNAIVIGFNVRTGNGVDEAAHRAGVDVRLYRIIYSAIEDIEAAMKGMLDPKFKEVALGQAEARQVFKVSGVGAIAGSYVLKGKITRNASVRVVRDGIVITEGAIESLRRFKDDVKEVAEGYECGIGIKNFNDIKEGDIIEAYIMEEIKQ
ncbi:MAG: translation initiation factor IF-2 [Clostridiales bacterium]|nr:translation initiation factor IF-2 [Clostridiales bacterium]